MVTQQQLRQAASPLMQQVQIKQFEAKRKAIIPQQLTPKTSEYDLNQQKWDRLISERKAAVEKIERELKASPQSLTIHVRLKRQQAILKEYQKARVGGYETGGTIKRVQQQVEMGVIRSAKASGFQRAIKEGQIVKTPEGTYRYSEEYLRQITKPQLQIGRPQEQISMKQPPGTYDPTTRSYVDPSGVGVNLLPGYEPPTGTKLYEPAVSYRPGFEAPVYKPPKKPILEKAKEAVIGVTRFVGETLGEVPVAVPSPRLIPSVLPAWIVGREEPPIRLSTLGEELGRAREAVSQVGMVSERGWKEIIGEEKLVTTIPERIIPKYEGETGVWTPEGLKPPREIVIPEREEITTLGLIPKVARVGPEVLAYTFAPEVTLSADILAAGEKLKTIEVDIKAETSKQYQEHLKEEVGEGYRHLTKEEFTFEITPEIRKTMEEKIALEAGVSMAFLGGVGVFRGIKFFKKPVVTYEPTGKPFSFFTEVKAQQPVMIAGKEAGEIPLSTYRIITKVPPTKKIVTTRAREVFGLKPREITFIGAKTYETKPALGPVIGELPHIAQVGKRGKAGESGRLKLYEVSGRAEPITPKEIMKLSPPEKYVWTGKPKILVTEEAELLAQARIDTIKYFGKEGKTTQMFYAAVRVKPRAKIGEIKLFETGMRFKETTKPLYRAAGRVEEVPGLIFDVGRLKPMEFGKKVDFKKIFRSLPEGYPKPTLGEIIKPIPVGKQVQILPVPVPKLIPKIPKLVPIMEAKQIPGEGFPLMVGGLGLKQISPPRVDFFEKAKVELKEEFVLAPKQVQVGALRVVVRPEVKLVPKLKERMALVTKPLIKLKEIPVVKAIPKLAVALKFKPMLKVAPRQIPRPRPRPRPPTPLKKDLKVPIIKSKEKKKKLKRRKGAELFIPFVRRYKRFAPIAKPTTKEKAFKLGLARLKGTLGASLQIREAKTGKPIKIAKETRMFRPGKRGKDPFTLVQKAPFRLKAPTEVKEIIASRRAGRTKFLK